MNTVFHDIEQVKVSLNDIKFDILKIIEPYDGRLNKYNNANDANKIHYLFSSYFDDLTNQNKIQEYLISKTFRESSITYELSIKMDVDRSPKKLRIHVGNYQRNKIER